MLLLFFIALALSLTVWVGLSLGTKQRAARTLASETHRVERPARAGSPAATAPKPPALKPAAGPFSTPSHPVREGRAGRHDAPPRPVRAATELPWLRPEDAREGDPERPRPGHREGPGGSPTDGPVGEPRVGPPRVVVTETAAPPGPGESRTGRRGGEQPPTPDAEPGASRATVTARQVERDAFDRFLDAERRRD